MVSPPDATAGFSYEGYIAIGDVRFSSLGIVQRDTLQQPGKLHAKARGIVYGLPWNTSAEDVIAPTQCTVLKHYSKYN